MQSHSSDLLTKLTNNDPSLTSLTIPPHIFKSDATFRKHFYAAIKVNYTLNTLIISNNNVRDEEADILFQHPTLKFLDVSRNPISNQGLFHLTQNSQLICLNLSSTKVDNCGAAIIAGNTHLLVLNLNDNMISDAGVEMLATHPTLKQLELSGCFSFSSQTIRTEGVQHITKKGVTFLAKNANLLVLSLKATHFNDKAAKVLSKSVSLKKIYLFDNALTSKCIKHFLTNQYCLFLEVTGGLMDKPSEAIVTEHAHNLLTLQRNYFIRFVLDIACLVSSFNETTDNNFFASLPAEVLLNICQFMTFPSAKSGIANSGWACADFIFKNFLEIRRRLQMKENATFIETCAIEGDFRPLADIFATKKFSFFKPSSSELPLFQVSKL